MRILTWLALALVVAGPAWAQAVLDVAAVPNLPAATRRMYETFLIAGVPRAFALSPGGQAGWQSGGTLETAREKALASCAAKKGVGCAIYAENLQVVWQGRAPETLASVPGPLFGGDGWEFVPDQRYFWHGPAKARGVYVFGHGKASDAQGNRDSRGIQPHSYVRYFNNNGFDVVRFDRAPATDLTDRAADWLREGLRKIRAQGYRMVIVGGQSRGAWNSLQILDTPNLADAVIAVSAATNGTDAGLQAGRGMAEIYRIFSRAHAPTTRVAIAQFRDDPYEHEPDKRLSLADELLRPQVASLLTVNQPEGITGHFGGYSQTFGERYAVKLYRFAVEGVRE